MFFPYKIIYNLLACKKKVFADKRLFKATYIYPELHQLQVRKLTEGCLLTATVNVTSTHLSHTVAEFISLCLLTNASYPRL